MREVVYTDGGKGPKKEAGPCEMRCRTEKKKHQEGELARRPAVALHGQAESRRGVFTALATPSVKGMDPAGAVSLTDHFQYISNFCRSPDFFYAVGVWEGRSTGPQKSVFGRMFALRTRRALRGGVVPRPSEEKELAGIRVTAVLRVVFKPEACHRIRHDMIRCESQTTLLSGLSSSLLPPAPWKDTIDAADVCVQRLHCHEVSGFDTLLVNFSLVANVSTCLGMLGKWGAVIPVQHTQYLHS